MEGLMPILFVVGIIVIIGAAIYVSHVYDKKRTADLAEKAEEMGLIFQAEADLTHRFSGFNLFNIGRSKRTRNLITGDAGDVAIAIFDYRYTTGSGKNQSTHQQTVVALSSPNLTAPDLSLRPEGFFDKLGGALGFQDIDFETHPQFSNMFVLKGSNEMAVRDFMRPLILELLEQKKGICLEAHGDTLFFYKARTLAKPDQVKDLLGEAYDIYNCVLEAHGQSPA